MSSRVKKKPAARVVRRPASEKSVPAPDKDAPGSSDSSPCCDQSAYGEYPFVPPERICGPVPCVITIVSSARTRSFNPPLDNSAKVVFRARLNRDLLPGETVQWSVVRGPNDGDVRFAMQRQLGPRDFSVEGTARKPNKAKLRVQIVNAAGFPVCEDIKDISVPQFVFVSTGPGFFSALEDFGLQTPVLPGDNAGLLVAKTVFNASLSAEVVSQAIGVSRLLLSGVNVRFTTEDPTARVGLPNVTLANLIGLSPGRDSTGLTFALAGLDVDNKRGSGLVFVYAREFTNTQSPFALNSRLYRDVFAEFSVRANLRTAAGGTATVARPGTPVQPGEFAPSGAERTVKQLKVRSALLAFARLVGSTLAHESCHAMGLVPGAGRGHNNVPGGNLMDEGFTKDFRERTGFVRYDPNLGLLTFGPPAGLRAANRRRLQTVLPILTA